MEIYIKLKRKEDGSWEGKTEIDLKKLWYLEINKKLEGGSSRDLVEMGCRTVPPYMLF